MLTRSSPGWSGGLPGDAVFLLAGLGTLGFVVPGGWWQPLVIASSIASIALLVIAFSPALALGFAIDAILIWLVVGVAWTPASLQFGT
jgi:hypothetical protein